MLRRKSGLAHIGPGTDVQVWREEGPDQEPRWMDLQLKWEVKSWKELGIQHGDVLVVQEHPSRLGDDHPDEYPRTAPEWFKQSPEDQE